MTFIEQDDSIIFIGGVQRSGTTLLRKILNQHPLIKIGYENAFYKILFEKYCNGIRNERIPEFLDDLIKTKRFAEWKIDLKSLELKLKNKNRTLTYKEAVLDILNEFFLNDFNNERLVGIKNPNSFLHIPFIYRIFPKAKIIILVRDPRAILASEKVKRLKKGEYNQYEYIWKTYRRFSTLSNQLEKHSDEIIHIYYEEIILNLKKTTIEICKFLEIDWHEELLYFYEKFEDLPSFDKNQHKLINYKPDKSKIDAYRSILSKSEIMVLEFLLKKNMIKHKYFVTERDLFFIPSLIGVYFYGIKQFFKNRLK